jgi:hypothetical protein
MKTKLILTLGLLTTALGLSALAQGTAFTYQGRLDSVGEPYNGSAEIQATLWDAASGGGQIAVNAPEQVIVAVTNGLFLLPLNFGANFPGADRWLQLAVRTSVEPFTTLTPRQPLTPTPYAITASNLTGTLPAVQLSGAIASANLAGTYSGPVTFNNAGNSFTGNGAGLTGLNASQLSTGTVPNARLAANMARTNQVWLLGGNAGTSPGTHFLGTTDNQALEFKVNGLRAFRLEDNGDSATDPDTTPDGAPNLIGGSPYNFVGPSVVGATIAGGGATNYSGSSYTNSILSDFGVIGGGNRNTIAASSTAASIAGGSRNAIGVNSQYNAIGGGANNNILSNAWYATIAGGTGNDILTNAWYATIAGGSRNAIGAAAQYSAIGGGWDNKIADSAVFATIAGGGEHSIGTNSDRSAIGGGFDNNIGDNSLSATIAGGYDNSIGTNASYSAIGGGRTNKIASFSRYATIAGGYNNNIGTNADYAFVAGRQARANPTFATEW